MTSEDFFNQIQLQFKSEKPFVCYRKPNEIEVKAILQSDNVIYKAENFIESGFVFSPFNNAEDVVLIPFEKSETISANVAMSSTPYSLSINSIETSNPACEGKKEHINLVEKGIDAIKNKELKKVVLSRIEIVKAIEENPVSIFKKLLQNYSDAFVYCWFHPKIGLWLGATPETLLQIEANRFTTMALAGTQKFEDTLEVSWKDKEKDEQQIVTDFIVSSLQSSVENIKVSKPETVKAGNVVHLKTLISGTLNTKQFTLKRLLNNLHPTPAVCGFPKETAKQFILENENYDREFYTGFLGELNLKKQTTRNSNSRNVENNAYSAIKTVSNLYVNLRCMQLKNNNVLIYVGGGITKNSIAENEWQETVSKLQTIKSVL